MMYLKKEQMISLWLMLPFIYESGADTHMDYVIVITALLKIRMERAFNEKRLVETNIKTNRFTMAGRG
ncbi:MAG: hypothetical protein CM1200mP10_08470 [Candidatus Neomarinimicrobiota bacterium]|nr:MAG: hypothetical protein CM1200mP10_08470 [Candidatus Neomarinimicrobiota bacterium]